MKPREGRKHGVVILPETCATIRVYRGGRLRPYRVRRVLLYGKLIGHYGRGFFVPNDMPDLPRMLVKADGLRWYIVRNRGWFCRVNKITQGDAKAWERQENARI